MGSSDAPLHPPTIIYGCEPPNIRLSWRGGTQRYFCINNRNLHLTERDFDEGTYEAGTFLGALCRELCQPARGNDRLPCPALVRSCQATKEAAGLAGVELHPIPEWERCAGVRAALDLTQTDEERFLLLAYLEDKYGDESNWRDELVAQWNENWVRVPNEWGAGSRRAKFDQMMWWTLRFPALIPQVWLNWLHAASESDLRMLDENPSRVDFVAFWRGERHVVEIDGPSHYAKWTGSGYELDEREYARNLKIERSLRAESWSMTRIGRSEVRDATDIDPDEDMFSAFAAKSKLLGVLPFYKNEGYPQRFPTAYFGLPELEPVSDFAASADDDIPF